MGQPSEDPRFIEPNPFSSPELQHKVEEWVCQLDAKGNCVFEKPKKSLFKIGSKDGLSVPAGRLRGRLCFPGLLIDQLLKEAYLTPLTKGEE